VENNENHNLFYCIIPINGIYGQSNNSQGGFFEIYTEVEGGTTNIDFVRFELYAVDNVWEYRKGKGKKDILPVIGSLNYAHSTDKLTLSEINVPTFTKGENYGIFHTVSLVDYLKDITFSNGKYKLEMKEINLGKTFTIYLDYTTDNYTDEANGDNDIWILYTISDNSTVKIKWKSDGKYEDV